MLISEKDTVITPFAFMFTWFLIVNIMFVVLPSLISGDVFM
jgi:hypothetical protein